MFTSGVESVSGSDFDDPNVQLTYCLEDVFRAAQVGDDGGGSGDRGATNGCDVTKLAVIGNDNHVLAKAQDGSIGEDLFHVVTGQPLHGINAGDANDDLVY